MKLLYCNINKVADSEIEKYMNLLPGFMGNEIKKYRRTSDQKSRLLARLMLLKCMKEQHKEHLIGAWKRDESNKPFIKEWDSFSISHSDDIVLFGHTPNGIGVDIEKKAKLDFADLSRYFHKEEEEYIKGSIDQQEAFYEVWVKKEAALKAMGLGITNGLETFSCLDDRVEYEGKKWYLYKVDIDKKYKSYYCSSSKDSKLGIKEFTLDLYA